MDVVFPRGEIVDNSTATDKQQQKTFLVFIFDQKEYMPFRNQVDNEVFGYGRTTMEFRKHFYCY